MSVNLPKVVIAALLAYFVLAGQNNASALDVEPTCQDGGYYYPSIEAARHRATGRNPQPPEVVLPVLPEEQRTTLRKEFLQKNGYLDPKAYKKVYRINLCMPYGLLASFNISAIEGKPDGDEKDAVQLAKRFLVKNAEVTGISDSSVLKTKSVRGSAGRFKIVFEPQTYNGQRVSRTEIYMSVKGMMVAGVYFHWFPERFLNLPKSRITESEAKAAIIGEKLIFYGFSGNRAEYEIAAVEVGHAKLVITPIEHPDKGLGFIREWQIEAGVERGIPRWFVYVDAMTGAITRTKQLFQT